MKRRQAMLESIRVGDRIAHRPFCSNSERIIEVTAIEPHPRGGVFDGYIIDQSTNDRLHSDATIGAHQIGNCGWSYGDQITRVVPVSFVKVAS